MKTYILPKNEIEAYQKAVLTEDFSDEESAIHISLMGLEELEVEDAKRKANIGDCLLFKYEDKLVPFQIIHKYEKDEDDGEYNVVLQSYYLLESRPFDKNTNVWKDAEIRQYLNGDFKKKFDKELIDIIKPTKVHTDNYVTEDDFYLLSHEEIGYEDTNNMFKPNVGSKVFDFYKEAKNDD